MEKVVINNNTITDNRGFSLVEMVVAVTILAIIFTPILNSFLTASRTNAKAQRTQNATSLSEDIMEEIKADSIEQLYTIATSTGLKIGTQSISVDQIDFISEYTSKAADAAEDDTGFMNNKKAPYKIVFSDVTATQGEKYDVVVTIDHMAYSEDSATDTDTDDVSNINIVKLPKLYDIQDSKDHAILSWELNAHDEMAAKNLAEEFGNDTDSTKSVSALTNAIKDHGTKTTQIVLSTPSGTNDVDVEGSVIYEVDGNELKYSVYSGHLTHIDKTAKDSGGPHVYLFYGMMPISSTDCFPNEVIEIQDNTTDTDTSDSSKRGIHNVYLMLQDEENPATQKVYDLQYDGTNSNLEIKYNGASLVKRSSPAYKLSQTKWDLGNGSTMFTNFKSKDTSFVEGRLYDEGEKTRIYQVTVSAFNTDDDARNNPFGVLTSTINAGNETEE